MIVLGIESSCDETSVALVEDGQKVLSNITFSQIATHKKFGGVVPEVAAREHLTNIDLVIWSALEEAKLSWQQVDRIAVVNGPGLISSLLVGVTAAKTLSWALNKELVSVNHLQAHICANFLTTTPQTPSFPFICLLASGGHTQLILLTSFTEFQLLGQTIDDSAGEAFDKVARLLGLDYPGGPALEKLAQSLSDDGIKDCTINKAFHLPNAKVGAFNFSYSGLKTAVLRSTLKLEAEGLFTQESKAKLAYSFQRVVCQDLAQKLVKAAKEFNCSVISIAGGVASNQYLRNSIQNSLDSSDHSACLIAPARQYCTDNGAMVASAGYYCPDSFGLDFEVYSRNTNKITN